MKNNSVAHISPDPDSIEHMFGFIITNRNNLVNAVMFNYCRDAIKELFLLLLHDNMPLYHY